MGAARGQDALLARARERLAHGPAAADDLVRAVYGVSGSTAPWRALLDALMSGRDGFERDSTGTWCLASEGEPCPVLVAGRATRALHGRLLALALCPLDAPEEVQRWYFEQEERAAGYVRRSARLDEDSERDARPFVEAASEIGDLLRARRLLVLDPALPPLLRQELTTYGASYSPEVVEVLGESYWLSGGRKRGMADLRRALGLVPDVADALLGELEVLRAIILQPAARSTRASASHGGVSAGSPLQAAAAELPECPGVYIFRDADVHALYVGSASNLQRRVLSYFTEQVALTRGLRGLLDRAATIEPLPLGTHLEALVEEALLIAALAPPYNVQRDLRAEAVWLRIGAEPVGNVVQVASGSRDDAALYVGPLPSREAATAVADVLALLWGFRRRGASPKVGEDSLLRLSALRDLLADADAFRAELRRRARPVLATLPPSRRVRFEPKVARAERAVADGELLPAGPDAGDAVVGRYDHAGRRLTVLVVRAARCLGGGAVGWNDAASLARLVGDLTARAPADPDAPTRGEAGGAGSSSDTQSAPEFDLERTVVLRWLHAHRADPFVVRAAHTPEEIVWRLLSVAEEEHARLDAAPPAPEHEWWRTDAGEARSEG